MTSVTASALAAQPFLRGLRPAQLDQLARLAWHVSVPAGQRLFDENATAGQFWIIDAGRVQLDASVPGLGPVAIETLGRNDVIGLSWIHPPYQWRFGATATQPLQAYVFDARAVRVACDADPVLGYELSIRFFATVTRRLQATRARLLEAHAGTGVEARAR